MAGFTLRRRELAIGAGVLAIVCIAAGIGIYVKKAKPSLPSVSALLSTVTGTAPGAQQPGSSNPMQAPAIGLSDIAPADMPPSVTLQKPAEIRFKKGTYFIAKPGTPLFFLSEYVRDAKAGEQFQILDYNPGTRHVFLQAKDQNGNIIALNTLDLHGCSKDVVTLPASTTVALQGVSDGNALVAYNGDKFAVPVVDTDLLQQAAARKAQRDGSGTP